MKIADAFSAARWRVCWVTTYTFEPAFFEAFLLRRLGDPPLNVVVLADAQRLADTWSSIGVHDVWRVPGVNRRYLVRGFARAAGAFHAKTILLANEKRGLLLVGSGNVGLGGLESGHEVYAQFNSNDGLEEFAAWREWIADLVTRFDDPLVRSRWGDLRARLPWLVGADPGAGSFVTNSFSPLADQFLTGIEPPVDELHLTAPFFDHDLRALTRLIDATRPRKLEIYLGDSASVDGARLVAALAASGADVRAHGYATDRAAPYVHAKMIAAVTGTRARLLAGSANLSGPALLGAVSTGGHVNVEAGVLRDVEASVAISLIRGEPRLSLVELPLDRLADLSLFETSDLAGLPVRLHAATRDPDGTITLASVPPPPDGARLTDGRSFAEVRGGRSAELLHEDAAQFVWLVNGADEVISNRVPVDELTALSRALTAQDSTDSDRPRELDPIDRDHPVARILMELHQGAVFDVADTPAQGRVDAGRGGESGDEAGEGDAFWDRYFEEELGRDPRARRYGANGLRMPDSEFPDEFGSLLLQMLHRAPAPNELRLLDGSSVTREEAEVEGHRWTMTQRLRVRAFNVLWRWSSAVNDPRVRWFGAYAPVRHYLGLLGALARMWPQAQMPDDKDRWLTSDQLARLAANLFAAFIRPENGLGYLASLHEDERATAVELLRAQGAPAAAAALAYSVLRGAKAEVFFAWQPFLVPALKWGVIEVADGCAELAAACLGLSVTDEQIGARLEHVANYIDDEHWCAQAVATWGFGSVALRPSGNPNVPLDLVVSDEGQWLRDPRFVGLARAALAYAKSSGLRLRVGADLLVLVPGTTLIGPVRGVTIESNEVLSLAVLDDLEARGVGFGAAFDDPLAAVS